MPYFDEAAFDHAESSQIAGSMPPNQRALEHTPENLCFSQDISSCVIDAVLASPVKGPALFGTREELSSSQAQIQLWSLGHRKRNNITSEATETAPANQSKMLTGLTHEMNYHLRTHYAGLDQTHF